MIVPGALCNYTLSIWRHIFRVPVNRDLCLLEDLQQAVLDMIVETWNLELAPFPCSSCLPRHEVSP